jgi:hypothetical protein
VTNQEIVQLVADARELAGKAYRQEWRPLEVEGQWWVGGADGEAFAKVWPNDESYDDAALEQNTAQFIATSRELVPRLCDLVEELMREREGK